VDGEHVAERAQYHGSLAVVEDPAADAGPSGSPECGMQQRVRGLALVAGAEVVGALVEVGVDLLVGHEVVDVQPACLRARGRGDLVVGQLDPPALADLVALDDVLVLDLLAVLGADAAMLDPGAVLGVDLVEAHGLRFGRGIDLDRHSHEAEGDRPVPDRAHGGNLPAAAAR